MARLYIMREKSMLGMMSQLNCYVNGKMVCQLANGRDVACNLDEDVVEFKCVYGDNVPSDPVYLDLRGKKIVSIIIKPGSIKPNINVLDKTAVASSMNAALRKGMIFNPTKIVGDHFAIDEANKKWAIKKGHWTNWDNSIPYRYDEVVSYELIENGDSVVSGGLGRALVGGFLFGTVGAIVGGVTAEKNLHQTCTSLMIKITISNKYTPVEYIKLISSSTDKNGYIYKREFKHAQEILSLLELICKSNEAESVALSPKGGSTADELRKYKMLMDEGVITEEEFKHKKKQLLGL